MKKFLLTAFCCGIITLGSNTEAAQIQHQSLIATTQTSATELQQLDFWSRLRDRIFDTEERPRHRDEHHYRNDYPPPPPPHDRYHHDRRHNPPPPRRH